MITIKVKRKKQWKRIRKEDRAKNIENIKGGRVHQNFSIQFCMMFIT